MPVKHQSFNSARRKMNVTSLLLGLLFIMPSHALDIHGHRGAYGHLPPGNTLPSFEFAVNLGVDVIEGDLQLSKDNVVVLNHDDSVSEHCQWAGKSQPPLRLIAGQTALQLALWDCHPELPGIQSPPTLRSVLALAEDKLSQKQQPVKLNLEFKQPGEPLVAQSMRLFAEANRHCKDCWMGRIIVQCFDWESCKLAKTTHATMPVRASFLSSDNYDGLEAYEPFVDILSPDQVLVSPALMGYAHSIGAEVVPWTVNDKLMVDKLRALGVQGVITDIPQSLIASLN